MSGVTGIGTASAIGASPATGNGSQLDQAAFLRLMTAQVAAQDPFKPLDQSQMLAQLAQFSQVAGTAEMNVSLTQLLDAVRDQTATLADIRERLPALTAASDTPTPAS